MLCALMVLAAVGCNDKPSNQDPEENPYDLLGIDNLHLGMWVTPPAGYRTQEAYDTLAACGINFVNGFEYFESDEGGIFQALTFAGNSNLKFLVADRAITQAISEYSIAKNPQVLSAAMDRIERYYQYPAYAGQLLLDEPGRNKFDIVQAFINEYRLNYPSKQWHVNLFPSYAEGGTGVPYEQYINDWMEMMQPNYCSYDSYPLLVPDENNPFTRYEIDDYYYNLDLLRTKTAQRRIPLWSFIQTLGISGTPGVPDKRVPSREDIRWQVFTNLAFGVKGLQYFCYWTPTGGSESFTDALIDTQGNKTVRYDYVKELNGEILSYGKELLQCDSKGVILNVAKPSDARFKLYGESLTSFGEVKSVSGDDVVIGCFYNPYTKKNSIMIVPTTPRDTANISLQLGSGVKSVTVWQKDGSREITVTEHTLNLTIEQGNSAYIIF